MQTGVFVIILVTIVTVYSGVTVTAVAGEILSVRTYPWNKAQRIYAKTSERQDEFKASAIKSFLCLRKTFKI